MRKKLLLFGALFLLADIFGSLFFILGKTPDQFLGLSTPKISITPFPTLVLGDKNDLPKTPSVNKNPVIYQAAINSVSNAGYKLAIAYVNEPNLPDPSLFELVALVCNQERCDSARLDMAKGWLKEISFTKAMDFSQKKQITLVIKIKGDSKSSVNVYTEDSSKK